MKQYTNTNEARHRIYELYQLDWLISHGYSLMDVVHGCVEEAAIATFDKCQTVLDATEVDDINPLECIEDGIRSWSNKGFNYEIWACFEEFLNAEYRDVSYVSELIKRESSNSTNLWSLYMNDIENNVPNISED